MSEHNDELRSTLKKVSDERDHHDRLQSELTAADAEEADLLAQVE
jgi:hypothetical protein